MQAGDGRRPGYDWLRSSSMVPNVRKAIYFGCYGSRVRGWPTAQVYRSMVRQDRIGVPTSLQRDRLAAILVHCRRNVPYYAGLMAHDQDCVKDPERYLRELPILTRDHLRTRFDELKSADLSRRQWWINSSGGSTGQPVCFIQDREYEAYSFATTLLFYNWAGYDFGEPQTRLWGATRDLFREKVTWRTRLYDYVVNVSYLNAFRMTPEKMREYLAILNQRPPKLLVAYAQALYEVARFAQREGIAVQPQRAIMTSAGTLYPFMREVIEGVFRCRVYNRYGSREVGDIASQCAALQGLHVSPWTEYVEIVDEQGRPMPPRAEGDILVTSLSNYAMPLIRYKIGDRGILAPEAGCSCGRHGQVLAKVTGRITDNFRARTGRVIPGEYFIHMIGVVLNGGAIKQFQVRQTSYDQIVLKIAKTEPEAMIDIQEIVSKIQFVMDDPCEVRVELVDAIPPEASGKYRYTISEVQG